MPFETFCSAFESAFQGGHERLGAFRIGEVVALHGQEKLLVDLRRFEGN